MTRKQIPGQIPIGLATCGYCGNPMQGRMCSACGPELAEIATIAEWQAWMTRKYRAQYGDPR